METLIFFGSIIAIIFIYNGVSTIRDWRKKAQKYKSTRPKHAELNRKLRDLEAKKEDFAKKKENELETIERRKEEIEKIAEEKTKGFPWLAKAYADYFHLEELKASKRLKTKKYPAPKAAEEVKRISKERRKAEEKLKTYKYIIEYYESLFPWLEDFKEFEEEELIKVTDEVDHYKENQDNASNWLSQEEYNKLSTVEKNQRALDRYRKRKKSNWEIGRDYERYVGYCYEKNGYDVDYQGIISGFEDMGRDLIAKKNGQTEIIQCKYWSQRKTIHEKHVFQLFGTTIEYFIKKHKLKKKQQLDFFVDLLKGSNIKGVFITNIELSDMATKVANALNIKVVKNNELKEYPIIKCNISKTDGEKIYHLPFDQQYDTVKIEPELGEKYVSTVKEAEELGFRRAFRWSGD